MPSHAILIFGSQVRAPVGPGTLRLLEAAEQQARQFPVVGFWRYRWPIDRWLKHRSPLRRSRLHPAPTHQMHATCRSWLGVHASAKRWIQKEEIRGYNAGQSDRDYVVSWGRICILFAFRRAEARPNDIVSRSCRHGKGPAFSFTQRQPWQDLQARLLTR